MTGDRTAHTPESAIPSGKHPFRCPRCEQRTGMVDLATGISTCSVCAARWRGPRLVLAPLDEPIDPPALAAKVLRDASHGTPPEA